MTGFEVIKTVGVDDMPAVVFVTAYDAYAIDAFDVQAVDYLLKPYDSGRFEKSLGRALGSLSSNRLDADAFEQLIERMKPADKHLDRIMVSVGTKYFFVNTNEIRFITADEKYLQLHTAKDTYLVRDTMNHMEEQLDPSKFARIHRSHMVNIDFIKEIEPWSHGDYVVILKNGEKLNLSRRYRDRLFDRG